MASADPAAAFASSAALREQTALGIVRVTGDDRVSWLNGQITNDVREIESQPESSVHALAVNVRGKIMAELWVAAGERDGELWLIVPRASVAELLEHRARCILTEDVET